MAALYLHNALYSPDPLGPSPTTTLPHNRNISVVSGSTLYTNHSHTAEPLLQVGSSQEAAYRDPLSQQPTYVDAHRLSLDSGHVILPLQEHPTLWDRRVRRRRNWLKLIERLLGILLGVWAVYNTVRYFLAFTLYNPEAGQTTSLVLGASTAISFALLLCAIILSVFQPYLLLHQVPLRTLLFTRKGFHVLSSFFLLAPTVYNLVLTFIWRNSTDPELNFRRRCHLDIDVVWSVSKAQCNRGIWGTWLALSITRLVLTSLIIIAYHMVSYRKGRRTHQYHYRRRPELSESQSSIPPSLAAYLPSQDLPARSNRHPQHQSSDSTLSSLARSKRSSSRHSSRALHPQPSIPSLYSDDDSAVEAEINEHIVQPRQHQELNSFADRFRTLISQITRETDLAMDIARPDSTSDEEHSNYYVPPAVGYDEFGRPYRQEEQVSFLNGYIRRMPTIESMGSREMGSMMTSTAISRRSTATFSIPPTRSNTRTVSDHGTGGHSPIRANGAVAFEHVSLEVGRTNEMGEFVNRSEDGHDASRGSGGAMSGRTTSTPASTVSYYTATSSMASPASEDKLDVPPHPPGLVGMGKEHPKQSNS